MAILLVALCILFINIPFGYWRSNSKRLSIQWLLAIHLPVPIAIWLRFSLIGWSWILLPVFVAAFAVGQYAGGKIRHHLAKQQYIQISSCLVVDLVRVLSAPSRR